MMAHKVRVWVDHHVCVGNAMCETIAPKVFVLNANRQSEAENSEGGTVEKILDAAETYPVSAIIVEAPVSWCLRQGVSYGTSRRTNAVRIRTYSASVLALGGPILGAEPHGLGLPNAAAWEGSPGVVP
jgi:ferredoxin